MESTIVKKSKTALEIVIIVAMILGAYFTGKHEGTTIKVEAPVQATSTAP